MTLDTKQSTPEPYHKILKATVSSGFTMASDLLTGSLLRTLAASKPAGRFLELGTGTGLSTSWILDGMDQSSSLISIDHEAAFLEIAREYLGEDQRLQLEVTDGAKWIENHQEDRYDYIFADTWHGKFLLLDETLALLKKSGLYIIDDLLPQANWPDGHQDKVLRMINDLESRRDLLLTALDWSTGIIIAVKK